MYILENVPLSAYSTMRLGGPARYITDITDKSDIPEAIKWAAERKLPIKMIGGGSNIIWGDQGFAGLVLVNKIMRYERFDMDEENAYFTVGAGENWDSAVERIVSEGFSGIEQLSLIPGTSGATPVQNVGAYGREISDVLTTLEVYDTQDSQFKTMPASDCEFGYRTSRFKTSDKDRFFITALTLHVTKTNPTPPFYQSLASYLSEKGVTTYTSQTIRDAVIAIRSAKLPDPAVVANNGSFFHNPIISRSDLAMILDDYPTMVYWQVDDQSVKISAAWLLEQAGFKDHHDEETGMATWKNQPLVLVNEKAEKLNQLLVFRQKIVDAVQTKFGITLQQEPEIIVG